MSNILNGSNQPPLMCNGTKTPRQLLSNFKQYQKKTGFMFSNFQDLIFPTGPMMYPKIIFFNAILGIFAYPPEKVHFSLHLKHFLSDIGKHSTLTENIFPSTL